MLRHHGKRRHSIGPTKSDGTPGPASPLRGARSPAHSHGPKTVAAQLRSIRHGTWQQHHAICPNLHRTFLNTEKAVAIKMRPHHARSYRLNVMLTLNFDDIARQNGMSHDLVLSRVMQLLRNAFRGSKHTLAGFWRREIGSSAIGGHHVHVVFHAPRGFARRLRRA